MRPGVRATALGTAAASVLVGVVTLAGGGSSVAAPGDPLGGFGAGGVLRVEAPEGCAASCPTSTSTAPVVRLETSGPRTILGYDVVTPEGAAETRPRQGAVVAMSVDGGAPWRTGVTGTGTGVDRTVLAVGHRPGTDQVIAVVGATARAATPEEPDIPLGQEVHVFTADGAPHATVTLTAEEHGAWTAAAVAPDGSVVGVEGDADADDLPLTTIHRHGPDGEPRWTRPLPVGDAIDAVDVDVDGRVILAGSRARPATETYDGLIVGLTPGGELDAGFGTGGSLVLPAPEGYGRGLIDVDVAGPDVAIVGDDQWQTTNPEADIDLAPGAALVGRIRDGQLLASFAGDGLAEQTWQSGSGRRVLPTGVLIDGSRTVATSWTSESDGDTRRADMTRYTATGAVDDAFAVDGTTSVGFVGVAAVPAGYVTSTPADLDGGTWGVPLRAYARDGTATSGPAAPTSLRLTGSGAGAVTLAWTPPPGAVTGYDVLVDVDRDGQADHTSAVSPRSSTPVAGLPADAVVSFSLRARSAAGLGPRTAWTAPTVTPFRTLDAFVDRQFRDFAGRGPTTAEAARWRSDLLGGWSPSAAVSRAVDFNRWASKQAPVIRLYQAYFLRLPDTGGLRYWVDRYRSGDSLSKISAGFAASREFRIRYGTLTNRQFVERIYLNILGRPGEASGVAFWTGELDRKRRSRGTVMVGFSESAEYRRTSQPLVDVVNVSTGMLRRVPTSSEHSFWIPRLGSGTPRTDLIAHLLGSTDYDSRIP